MVLYLIYASDTEIINSLCIGNLEWDKAAPLIPRIGETFIDDDRKEYEVVDIVRSLKGNEYTINVRLCRRDIKKYK